MAYHDYGDGSDTDDSYRDLNEMGHFSNLMLE